MSEGPVSLDVDRIADELKHQIEKKISESNRCALGSEKAMRWLKIGSAFLTATATVILGLSVSSSWNPSAKNAALVISALVTVVNATDALYNPRFSWLQSQLVTARLCNLQREIKFYLCGRNKANIELGKLEQFHNRLCVILEGDMSTWAETLVAGEAR